MPSWVDSHCHLQERYVEGAEAGAAVEALRRAARVGVLGVVCVGTDEATSLQALALARDVAEGRLGPGLPQVRATVGLHPHEAEQPSAWLNALLEDHGPWIAGIGECGLDYYYEHAPRADQRRSFAEQIQLAHRSARPLVIHARDAWDDLFAILDAEGTPVGAVLHCFTGGPGEARGCVERGLSVSFSGIVTFKSAGATREALREVPLARLLVETDSPFLAPVPHRGATNEPAFVPLVGASVAATLGLDESLVARSSSASAARIFGFDLGDPLLEGSRRHPL
jgi:TatD DNase family protein